MVFQVAENARKHGVSSCRKCKETRCFKLPKIARKQGVSIRCKVQGNKVFQSVKSTRKEGVSICRKVRTSHEQTQLTQPRTSTFEFWSHQFKLWTPPGWSSKLWFKNTHMTVIYEYTHMDSHIWVHTYGQSYMSTHVWTVIWVHTYHIWTVIW